MKPAPCEVVGCVQGCICLTGGNIPVGEPLPVENCVGGEFWTEGNIVLPDWEKEFCGVGLPYCPMDPNIPTLGGGSLT